MTWKPDVCIYHGGCDDGFGAALAVWKKWGNAVVYVPGSYGKPIPDVTDKHVLFVAAWFQRGDGQRQFSLRSTDERVDVSEVAKKFGGGGHRNAAGFQIIAAGA